MVEHVRSSLSLEPELDALGLAGRIDELEARGPIGVKGLTAFRLGLAEGTHDLPEIPSDREDDIRNNPAYDTGIRAAHMLLETKGAQA